MMRRWLTILAVFGVVLHAGLVARHNGMMVTAKLDHQSLVTALSVLCHGLGPSAGADAAVETPFIPMPGSTEPCPACGALCAMAAAPVPDQVMAEVRQNEASVRIFRRAMLLADATAGRRPPPTGPPALI